MKINRIELFNVQNKNVGFEANVKNNNVQNQNINEVSKSANSAITSLGKAQVNNASKVGSMISFAGGKTNQVAHLISEGALSKGGGVATVINDWIKQWGEYKPQNGVPTQHNFFIPYYNGDVIVENGEVQVHPVTLEENGTKSTYYVADVDDITKVKGNKGKKFKLEEVTTGIIRENDTTTGEAKDVEYKIFEATDAVPKEFLPEGNTARVFMVAVPKTASMSKQYAKRGGDFAYVGGELYENYAQFAKATIEGMPNMGSDIDPRNIVIHDWHPSAAAKFIQDQANAGVDMYQDVNIGYIIHNIGRGGYQGLGSSEFDMFKALATEDEFKAVVGSKEFKELTLSRGPETPKKWGEFWKKLMPNMVDEKGTINPSMIPIKLAETGYVSMAGVSPSYVEECAENPEFAEGLTKALKVLRDNGQLIGVTNGLAKPSRELQISPNAAKYYNEKFFENATIKYADGTLVKPMKTFDPVNVDIKEVDEVKKYNKYNFIERLVKYKDIEELPENMSREDVVAGVTKGKPANITSTLNEDTLKSLEEGNPKLFVSWGRGDFQKAFDEVLDGIIKYVKSDEDDGKSIFVICGGLQPGEEGDNIKKIIKEMAQMPELKGRFAYIDGWGPADAMASAADFALFPSRFEPCGLTPQETYARGGLVISSNTGGMKKTVIDYTENPEKATGFRTKNGFYYIDPEKIRDKELEKTPAGAKLIQVRDNTASRIKSDIETENKKRARYGLAEEIVSDKKIMEMAKESGEYKKAVRAYRDDVMSSEIATTIAKATNLDSSAISKMRLNAITREMDWHNNVDTNDGKSAMERYEEHFFKNFEDNKTAKAPKIEFINKAFVNKLIKETNDSINEPNYSNFVYC
ncbi:MAG: glycogen synthase [Cyanobacteria bacterium SIG30]|nr:glycogen synthase [Cyanobacteria bacterium SIG30]